MITSIKGVTARVRMVAALVLAALAALVAPARAWASVDVSDPRVVADSSMKSGQVTTWDCVWLGSYPQTYVDDAATVAALDAATGWDAEGDLSYGGVTYRRLQSSDATYTSTSSSWWSWGSKASPAGYCYFRWEPIKWRVIEDNGTTALVVADVALDDQRYNETSASVTWEACTLRGWLNATFWGDAFTNAQQGAVTEQALPNANSIHYGTSGGASTTDNVFLLAESDVWNGADATRHGFVTAYGTDDEARRCRISDYAHAMGAWECQLTGYLGNCWCWLRSPGYNASHAAIVGGNYGEVDREGFYVTDGGTAVRPALTISLSSNQVSWAGTVSSNGDVNEQAAPGDSSGESGGGTTPSDPDDPGTENDGIVWAAGYDFLDDSYSFENFIAWIPYGYWATLYESGAGKLFWKKQLQGGVCYGMSLTTASILSSQPGVGRFSYGGASHGRLRDLVLSSASYAYVGSGVMGSVALVNNNVGAITIDSYIKYAQIYQYSTEATDSEGWGWAANAGYNQMRQILTYVKGRIDEGGYVAISMYKTGSAHTVLAVGYEGDDIIIDDPNDSEGPRRLTVREDGTWTFNGPAAYSSDDEGSKLSVENYVRQDLALRPWQILSSGVASMSGADWALGKSEADAGDILVIGANTLDSDNALVKVEADSYQLDTPDVVALDNAAGTSEIEGEAGVDTTGMYWVLGANDVSVSGLEGDSCTVEVGADEALVSASVPGGSDVSVGIEGEDSHVEVASEEGGDVSLSFETTDGDGGDVVVTVSGTSLPGGAEAESEDGEYSFAGLSDVTFELESDGSKSEAHVDCPEGEGVVVMVEEGDGGEPELSVSKSIRQAGVVVSGGSVYTGQPVEPLLAVTLDGAELLEGTDYTVAYEDNVNAGTATAKVTGIGTYAGAVTVQFEIAKSPQEVIASAKSVAMGKTVALGAKASGGGELTYKSSNAEVAKVGTGGKITPVNVGTAEVTVTAAETDNYESATKTVKVTVTKGTQAVTASGKSVQVKKTVKLAAKTSGDGKLTYKSSNTTVATVSAKGVVTGRRVGTAKITITAAETANYKSAKKTITVRVKYANPMTVKAKKATVAVSFSKLKTKAVTLASNVTVSKAKGKVTYANASTNATAKKFKVNAKTGKVTVPKGTKKGTYKVKIKVKAAGNTSYLSGSKTVTYKVRVK